MTPITFSAVAEENRAIPDLAELARTSLCEGDILNGPALRRFEAAVASAAGRAHAVVTSSGTDALFFALTAAGIGPGDEVIVPAFSFVATAGAIVRTGATPVYADIQDADGEAPYTLDLDRARDAVTGATKALVWVGMFGGWRDPAPVERLAADLGLILIEDAAQSFGAGFGNRPAGSMGLASAFSFDRQKVLGAPGTGGALVTDDDGIAARARALRWHGLEHGVVERLGYNSQMSEFSAAVLNAKLELLPGWLQARQAVADRFDEAFADLPLLVPRWPDMVTHVRHKYVVATERRAHLEHSLAEAGVPTRRHYDRPLTAHPALASGACPTPNAERLAEHSLSLPIHPFLNDAQVAHVITAVRRFFA